ncbi:MAG TPA: DUF5683 domain-containing protein [candidate division Zixibacteria bacterium]
MSTKRISTMLSLGLVIWMNSSVLAQQSGTKDSYLDIVSNPSGATVRLKGDYDLIVTAPCGINQELSGEYNIKAFKRGYESWSSRVWFNQGNPHQLTIDLKSKNRLKAGLRSALIPGWGQFYCEEKGKSFIMGISTLGGVVAFVLADNDYSNKYDDYVWARNRFDSNKEAEKWEEYKQLLDEKQREAYDAENLRRATLGIAIGIWAYNVLDAVLFFPYNEEETLATKESKVALELNQGTPSLVFTKKF